MRLLSETTGITLPMAPMWYGIITLIVFGVSLGVTLAFRGAANRHNPAAFHGHDDATAVHGASGQRSIGPGH
jgi:hypothetical protein